MAKTDDYKYRYPSTLKQWRYDDSDTVILGCTHYPLIYNQINHFDGEKSVISSGLETAREVSALLTLAMNILLYVKPTAQILCQW